MNRQKVIAFYLFASPWILGFVFFMVGPFFASAFFAFTEWDLISPPKWIGIQNFVSMGHDRLFWQSLKVTLTYGAISIPLSLAISLFLAVLLNQSVRGVSVFRGIFYIPAIILSGVAVANLWAWMYNREFGFINYILNLIGIQGPGWLSSEVWALPSIIIMSLWGCGTYMVIFLAGLQNIPQELYEAAEVDGAGWWAKSWNVTIPMLSPIILFNLIIGIISSFQIFTQVYVMTMGGPNNATLFYLFYLYKNAFSFGKMGYASALAWVMLIIILVISIIIFKTSTRWVYYESEEI
ncbi:MAG: sugar ABC transporter permease [Actinobacteria bacterium]|nr:sugar ABC transporter permease [Actinomycetota bacterium]